VEIHSRIFLLNNTVETTAGFSFKQYSGNPQQDFLLNNRKVESHPWKK